MQRIYSYLIALTLASSILFFTPQNLSIIAAFLATLPIFYFCYKALQLSLLHAAVLYVTWTTYTSLVFSVLYPFVGKYVALFVYVPLLLVFKDIKSKASISFLITQTVLWDFPLLIFMKLMSTIHQRALEPFYSSVNDSMIVGSLPFACDVETLSKLNVGAVVNMCREYEGPVTEYARLGILQHRVPTPDLCEPELAAVIIACDFMRGFENKQTGKRIFIHCKGGRARAPAMALCYLLEKSFLAGNAPDEASVRSIFELLKSKRHVVSNAILNYPVVSMYRKFVIKFEKR